MEKFTTVERIKIVQFYFEKQHSTILTKRAYRRHFNVRNAPSESMIRRFGKVTYGTLLLETLNQTTNH